LISCRDLIRFPALTAYRHPEVMRRGDNRSKEVAWVIAEVASYPDEQSFRRL